MLDRTGANLADGILLIDKDKGETSYGVVRKVKYALVKLRVHKIGHAGTLDPFATGLLIILLGQGTKLSNFIMSENKVYLATMRLGVETDTLDPTGQVIGKSAVPDLSLEYIQEKTQGFVGDIEQVPPKYSAVKYKGERSYKLARRGVKMNLKKRKVAVHSFRILSVDLPDVTMEVRCSRGTYIRSLAADLGKSLGPGAHLRSLRRLAIGAFDTRNALCSKEIPNILSKTVLLDRVISLRSALPGMHEIEGGELLAKKVRSGYQPGWEELGNGSSIPDCEVGYVKLVSNGELVAIMRVKKGEGVNHEKMKIERVFS